MRFYLTLTEYGTEEKLSRPASNKQMESTNISESRPTSNRQTELTNISESSARPESRRISNPIHTINDPVQSYESSIILPPLINTEDSGPFSEHNIDAPAGILFSHYVTWLTLFLNQS